VKKIIMTFFLLLFISSRANYAVKPIANASQAVQEKLNAIHSMYADFDQIITSGKRQISHSSGSMALLRPGHFHWQTRRPMAQRIVADGTYLWVYDVDLEQVTVRKQDNSVGGLPGLFLNDDKNTVARDFNVTKIDKTTTARYDLQAKSAKENYQQVKLLFHSDRLLMIEFFDQLGQHTVVRLKNIKINRPLQLSLFQFTPPNGVDIVKQ
jgi:outer membrane lipoprotein carrier protein